MPEKKLSANQKKFVRQAENAGLEVDFGYSGRGMYGETCPAVRVDYSDDFKTTANTCSDSMGRGIVIYCPR